jgi:hypothetical protein
MTTPEVPKPKKKIKKWQIVVIVLLGFMLIGMFSDNNSTPNAQLMEEQRQKASDELTDKYTVEPAWYPADYEEYSSNLAWRWGTSKETTCSYSSGSCWSVMVISKSGCSSSLYGEIKIFDSSDVQIDYTNDSTSTVSPMQKVKLTFDTFNKQAQSAQVGELKCY